jgi:2-polyprenyl-3-methyl-5-hydroxy-6-metoxy-1,4-benzoquinol methylase
MDRLDCPLCGSPAVAAFSVGDRNRELTAVTFHYRRCGSCATLFLADVPDDLSLYYPEEYYQMPSLAELDRAAAGEAPKLQMLTPFAAGGRLVDVGAAYGIFSRAAKLAGYEVTAIEMDKRCCDYLETTVGVRAIRSEEPERALSALAEADVVVLWHVLEHLAHPAELLAAAARLLQRGGVLAVAMPNPESLQFRLLGSKWAHVDAPRHLSLIPLAALSDRAEALGFEVAHVTSSDPAGRHWNAFGWEYALRRRPARRRSTLLTLGLARTVSLALAPLERRGMNGSAYTAVLVKR